MRCLYGICEKAVIYLLEDCCCIVFGLRLEESGDCRRGLGRYRD